MRDKATIKIALICNMNNMFSALCKYLIDNGYDAHLFQYYDQPEHFDFKSDTFGDILNNRVHTINWTKPMQLFDYPIDEIRNNLSGFDFLIGCGSTPAFLNKAGIKLDLFIPYGSDIYSYPFFVFLKNPINFIRRLYFQYHQRAGIRNAKHFIMERQLDWVEKKITSLKIPSKRIFNSIPMVHLPTYTELTPKYLSELKFYNFYHNLRNKFDLIIFHHSRHSWKNPVDKFEFKGNNYLFEGFSKFIKETSNVKSCIITLEYGSEVNESKTLISNLGIHEHVFWLPLQERKELMIGISQSDLVVGELFNSFNLYGVTIEALVMGKPIMQKRHDSDFINNYKSLHPIIYADSAESVAVGLNNFYYNLEKNKIMGLIGRKWYEDNIIKTFQDIIDKIVLD